MPGRCAGRGAGGAGHGTRALASADCAVSEGGWDWMTIKIMVGDALSKLAELQDEKVHCVVTSPPSSGLVPVKWRVPSVKV